MICVFSFLFFIFGFCQATILYLEPVSGQYQSGDTFIVEIRVDAQEECINTISVNLSFPQDILEAKDFSTGNSILTLWVESPTIYQESGLISFAGGIPGGYCGRIFGDPGQSNLLGRLVFRAREGEAKLEFLNTSQVLLNDGFGTLAKLSTKGAVVTILPEKLELPKDEWLEEIKKDAFLPEPFEIKIQQNPTIFEDKYFITFSTTDKQTGVDYYQVKEGKKDWKEITSPYLLEDQTLQSIIKVKAVDMAGNERIAEYRPPKKAFPFWLIILISFGIVIWAIWQKIFKK